MSDTADPRCPECGGAIGRTAIYCMHCSADLTEDLAAADADEDGVWDGTEAASTAPAVTGESTTPAGGRTGGLLASDGLVDNTLTVVVGIVGGTVAGTVGTIALTVATGSGWAIVFGLFAWLVATAYLVRRRTVQGAVEKSGYAVALALLLVPVTALSPAVGVDGGLDERGSLFVVLLLFVAVPAGIAAGVGWIASQFVPEGAEGSED